MSEDVQERPATWDFDEGWDEADQKPFRFKFMGDWWELPRDVPAETILHVERLMIKLQSMGEDEDLPDDFVIDDSITPEGIARRLAPDYVDEWVARGCGYRRLLFATRSMLAFYRGQPPPTVADMEARQGDGQRGNRAARRAAARAARKPPAAAAAKKVAAKKTAAKKTATRSRSS